MVNLKQIAALACGVALGAFASGQAQAELFTLFDSSNPGTAIGTFASIDTAGTGASHYDYSSASGHPSGVDLGPTKANFWVHENTLTGEYSFGFIFGEELTTDPISAPTLSFRVVGSDTDVFIALSDDRFENQEVAPGTFEGSYLYRMNTDGILVGGITGTDWTIIIDAVGFDVIDSWQAASGDGNHLDLQLDSLYQISVYDGEPTGINSNGGGQGIAEPAAIALFGAGLMGLGIFGRRRRKH